MHVGCKCNVVIATCPQRYLESTFLRCHNVVITTLSQPKDNVVTTLSQRDFVCWVVTTCGEVGATKWEGGGREVLSLRKGGGGGGGGQKVSTL